VIRTIEIQSGKVGMKCLQVGAEGEIAFDFPANASSPIIFPNLDQTIKQWSESVRPIELVKGVIHGNLHLNSIFFNQAMLAWLTSFNQCESDSFILIDLLKLAHNLRFKWSKRILPADWMMIEYAALGANPQELLENGSWEKMVVILEAIESQADAQDNLEEGDFSAGLLGMNLSQLSRIDQAAMQGCDEIQGAINLLLSTLLLARKLTHKNSAADLTFAIEHDNQMVIIDENQIELTTQEYKLLCFLEENVNKTVSRAEIANAVFDDVNYDPNDSIEDRGTIDYNRVTMTMSRLREKIDPAGSDYKFISTVRGKGYRLNLEDEAA
jgi:DNA-binding winged helix-turn-helix (wHTH) protein